MQRHHDAGRAGGRAKSARKKTAARRNGTRGGRPRNAEIFRRRVMEMYERVRPKLPEADPHDLLLVCESLCRQPMERLIMLGSGSGGLRV